MVWFCYSWICYWVGREGKDAVLPESGDSGPGEAKGPDEAEGPAGSPAGDVAVETESLVGLVSTQGGHDGGQGGDGRDQLIEGIKGIAERNLTKRLEGICF